MGVESTAILLRWLIDPTSRNFPLSQLIVITLGFASQVGLLGDFWGKRQFCPKNQFD
jgi:hypothetical protein